MVGDINPTPCVAREVIGVGDVEVEPGEDIIMEVVEMTVLAGACSPDSSSIVKPGSAPSSSPF